MQKIAKAYEMTNARITFVSLVNKAANKKQFLIIKAKNGYANFQTYGRILKADPEAHYVTGIVYEPMTEDTQGNFMTEEEITKAAHWFAKNGNNVDLQHSFEPLEGASVVESSVAKCDYELNGEIIKKGTWVMTVEVTDPKIFDAIEKGELTGFSMGGMGRYSTEDVNLEEPVKKSGVFRRAASKLGFGSIKKGAVKDSYLNRIVSQAFWEAFYALQDALFRWNYYTDEREYEHDPQKIQEALSDFNEIVTDILTQPDKSSIEKSVDGIVKAGKEISSANRKTLEGIHESLGEFLAKFKNNEEEEIEVTKSEIQEIVKAAVVECTGTSTTAIASAATGTSAAETHENITKEEIQEIVKQAVFAVANTQPVPASSEEKITKADVQEMIDAAIRKATGEEGEPSADPDDGIGEAIAKAVTAAMEPFMKQAGLPTNLNNTNVQKAEEEQHYMHGFI